MTMYVKICQYHRDVLNLPKTGHIKCFFSCWGESIDANVQETLPPLEKLKKS